MVEVIEEFSVRCHKTFHEARVLVSQRDNKVYNQRVKIIFIFRLLLVSKMKMNVLLYDHFS